MVKIEEIFEKASAELDKTIDEISIVFKSKMEDLNLEETIKVGLFAGTSITLFPILKASAALDADLHELADDLERLSPWRTEFWNLGTLDFLADLILGKQRIGGEGEEEKNTNDPILALTAILISYYIVYHPRAFAEIGTNVVNFGRMLIGRLVG